MLIWPTEPI